MQDRFNFRVYKKLEKRMIYNVTYLNPLLLDERLSEEAKNNILMQCTGLKDKNGTLMYENDIVKIGNGSVNGSVMKTIRIVEWDKKEAKFIVPSFQNDENGNYVEGNFSHYYEVIGNIYETPELLEA